MRKLSLLCAVAMVFSGLAVAAGNQNQAIARQVFEELFSKGRYELIDQLYTRDCVVHFGNRTARLEEAVEEGKGWREAAPDLAMRIGQVTEKGDKVTVEWTLAATNTGVGNGIPATGKKVQLRGRSIFRFVNGKIAEVWENADHAPEIKHQLGVKGER